MNDEPPDKPKQHQDERPQAGLVEIINTVADRVEPLLTLWRSIAEGRLKAQQAEDRLRTHLSWVAVAVVALVVVVSAVLTYADKLDGSTFSLLLGTVVGYMLTFIRSWLASPEE